MSVQCPHRITKCIAHSVTVVAAIRVSICATYVSAVMQPHCGTYMVAVIEPNNWSDGQPIC